MVVLMKPSKKSTPVSTTATQPLPLSAEMCSSSPAVGALMVTVTDAVPSHSSRPAVSGDGPVAVSVRAVWRKGARSGAVPLTLTLPSSAMPSPAAALMATPPAAVTVTRASPPASASVSEAPLATSVRADAPGRMVTEPPSPVPLWSPARMYTDPAAAAMAASPVVTMMSPLPPNSPECALRTTTRPEANCALWPLLTSTSPPLPASASPPARRRPPPPYESAATVLGPPSTTISPPAPARLAPPRTLVAPPLHARRHPGAPTTAS
mmetsp:Transcript_6460/g.19419  ORF Transcript_6460/g.19419 Transcript_6460/m.19419 type:complete len:266 (+) Transcript_6460:73-870(+)